MQRSRHGGKGVGNDRRSQGLHEHGRADNGWNDPASDDGGLGIKRRKVGLNLTHWALQRRFGACFKAIDPTEMRLRKGIWG